MNTIAIPKLLANVPSLQIGHDPDSMPDVGAFVYFLCDGEDIVYVGKTTMLRRRARFHVGRTSFDAVFYLSVPEAQLSALEEKYIRLLKPTGNTQHNLPERHSLTLWLPESVVENLNELVLRRSDRKEILTRSDLVASLINDAHRKAKR